MSLTISPVRNAEGGVVGASTIGRDITEHVKQTREIKLLNQLYSVLSRVSQAVVRATSPEAFLELACQEIVEAGGFLSAWIGYMDPVTCAVVPTAFWGGIGEYARGIKIYTDNRPERAPDQPALAFANATLACITTSSMTRRPSRGAIELRLSASLLRRHSL